MPLGGFVPWIPACAGMTHELERYELEKAENALASSTSSRSLEIAHQFLGGLRTFLPEQQTQVYVVADAISARNDIDTEVALRRMEQAGAAPVTREMVGFEWLRRADAPAFKTFSKY